MDLCLSGMSPVQIYIHSLHTHGSGGSSSWAEDENLKYQTISTIHFFISDYFYQSSEQSCRGLLSLSEQRYCCIIIMGNLAGQ